MAQIVTLLTSPNGFPAGTTFTLPTGVNYYGEEIWIAGVDLGSGVGYELQAFRYNRGTDTLTQIAPISGRNSVTRLVAREANPVMFVEARTTTRVPPTGTLVGHSQSNNTRACRWTLASGLVPVFDDIVGQEYVAAVSQNGQFAVVARDLGGTYAVYVVPAFGDPVLTISGLSDSAWFYWISNDGQRIGGVDDSGDVDPFIAYPSIWVNGVKEIVPLPANDYAEVAAASDDGSFAAGYMDLGGATAFVYDNGVDSEFDPEGTNSYAWCEFVRPDGAASVWTLSGTTPGSVVGALALVRTREGTVQALAPTIDTVSILDVRADLSRIYVRYIDGSSDSQLAKIDIPTGYPGQFWTGFVNSVVT